MIRELGKAVRGLLHKIGLDLVIHVPGDTQPEDAAIHSVMLPLWVHVHGSLRFVQIGANDGIRTDPMRGLIEPLKLSGLMVEPLPDVFDELERAYGDYPRIDLACVAITETPGRLLLHRFRPDAPIPDYAHGMATIDRARLMRLALRWGVRDQVEAIEVEGATLEMLLASKNISGFEFLQVDAEGADGRIVLEALALPDPPPMICYEREHLGAEQRQRLNVESRRLGYVVLARGQNVFMIRRAALEALQRKGKGSD